ncbi:hypothetical protein CUC08_Gglean003510 [Alternaria sp. MG1]|nr:hypothetical protein CUC08_Gglean003510 [Alternaria sp. MG1]
MFISKTWDSSFVRAAKTTIWPTIYSSLFIALGVANGRPARMASRSCRMPSSTPTRPPSRIRSRTTFMPSRALGWLRCARVRPIFSMLRCRAAVPQLRKKPIFCGCSSSTASSLAASRFFFQVSPMWLCNVTELVTSVVSPESSILAPAPLPPKLMKP